MTEEEIKQATCQVVGKDESGTGWLITADLVLTAYHCVECAVRAGEPVVVRFGAGSSAIEFTVVVGPHDEDLDVCLLRLPLPLDVEPIPIDADGLRPGEKWFAFGYPVAKLQLGHIAKGEIQQVLTERVHGVDLDLSVEPGTQLCLEGRYRPFLQLDVPADVDLSHQLLVLLQALAHAEMHSEHYGVALNREMVDLVLSDVERAIGAPLRPEDRRFVFTDALIEAGAASGLVETYSTGVDMGDGMLPFYTKNRADPDEAIFESAMLRLRAGAGATVPLHHAPCVGQRTRANQRGRASGAQAQDRFARRHQPPRDVTAGVHAAAGGAGGTATPAPDSLQWRSGTQRQAARAGGAAGTRLTRAGRTARRVRGDVRSSPPSAAELGQVAQARVRDRPGSRRSNGLLRSEANC